MDAVRVVVRWCAGFFETHAAQSMTRLCAILFAVVGAVIGFVGATIALVVVVAAIATQKDVAAALASVSPIVQSLALLSGVFVTNGSVAIALRARPSGTGAATAPATAPPAVSQ